MALGSKPALSSLNFWGTQYFTYTISWLIQDGFLYLHSIFWFITGKVELVLFCKVNLKDNFYFVLFLRLGLTT